MCVCVCVFIGLKPLMACENAAFYYFFYNLTTEQHQIIQRVNSFYTVAVEMDVFENCGKLNFVDAGLYRKYQSVIPIDAIIP